jgi:hypothetical protein
VSIQRDIDRSKRRLNQMLSAPVVHLGEVSTMASLILSVEETMKHERSELLQRGDDLEAAGQWMYSLQNTADTLKQLADNRTCMEQFVENFDEIDADFAKLSAWHHRVKELRQRQLAKLDQYSEYLQAAE